MVGSRESYRCRRKALKSHYLLGNLLSFRKRRVAEAHQSAETTNTQWLYALNHNKTEQEYAPVWGRA